MSDAIKKDHVGALEGMCAELRATRAEVQTLRRNLEKEETVLRILLRRCAGRLEWCPLELHGAEQDHRTIVIGGSDVTLE